MKNTTIIFGKRSNLTNFLLQSIKDSIAISILNKKDAKLIRKIENPNIIINQFYPVFNLSKIKDYEKFYKLSLFNLLKILDFFKKKKINKIIYTSSSSVYGFLGNINNLGNNRDLYSSTKLACENLIKNYSQQKKSDYIIARVFNMYGGHDKFSVIAKLLKSIRKKKEFTIFNNGENIRDFINVHDVAAIYSKLINYKFSGTIDVGTGYGTKIKNLVESINKPKIKLYYNHNIYNGEIICSIANNNFIVKNLKYIKFTTLKDFFLNEGVTFLKKNKFLR